MTMVRGQDAPARTRATAARQSHAAAALSQVLHQPAHACPQAAAARGLIVEGSQLGPLGWFSPTYVWLSRAQRRPWVIAASTQRSSPWVVTAAASRRSQARASTPSSELPTQYLTDRAIEAIEPLRPQGIRVSADTATPSRSRSTQAHSTQPRHTALSTLHPSTRHGDAGP
jgi:hypothetical protein